MADGFDALTEACAAAAAARSLNRPCAQMLLETWKRVASHSQHNGMTAAKLAFCAAPCLAWQAQPQASAQAPPPTPSLACPTLLQGTCSGLACSLACG